MSDILAQWGLDEASLPTSAPKQAAPKVEDQTLINQREAVAAESPENKFISSLAGRTGDIDTVAKVAYREKDDDTKMATLGRLAHLESYERELSSGGMAAGEITTALSTRKSELDKQSDQSWTARGRNLAEAAWGGHNAKNEEEWLTDAPGENSFLHNLVATPAKAAATAAYSTVGGLAGITGNLLSGTSGERDNPNYWANRVEGSMKELSEQADQTYNVDKDFEQTTTGQVLAGVGQLGFQLALGYVTGGAGMLAKGAAAARAGTVVGKLASAAGAMEGNLLSMTANYASNVGQEYTDAYQSYLDSGFSSSEARFRASMYAPAAGVMESLSDRFMLASSKLGGKALGMPLKWVDSELAESIVKKYGRAGSALASATVEGSTEAAQRTLQNFIGNKQLFEGAWDEGKVGFLLGGVAKGVESGAQHLADKATSALPEGTATRNLLEGLAGTSKEQQAPTPGETRAGQILNFPGTVEENKTITLDNVEDHKDIEAAWQNGASITLDGRPVSYFRAEVDPEGKVTKLSDEVARPTVEPTLDSDGSVDLTGTRLAYTDSASGPELVNAVPSKAKVKITPGEPAVTLPGFQKALTQIIEDKTLSPKEKDRALLGAFGEVSNKAVVDARYRPHMVAAQSALNHQVFSSMTQQESEARGYGSVTNSSDIRQAAKEGKIASFEEGLMGGIKTTLDNGGEVRVKTKDLVRVAKAYDEKGVSFTDGSTATWGDVAKTGSTRMASYKERQSSPAIDRDTFVGFDKSKEDLRLDQIEAAKTLSDLGVHNTPQFLRKVAEKGGLNGEVATLLMGLPEMKGLSIRVGRFGLSKDGKSDFAGRFDPKKLDQAFVNLDAQDSYRDGTGKYDPVKTTLHELIHRAYFAKLERTPSLTKEQQSHVDTLEEIYKDYTKQDGVTKDGNLANAASSFHEFVSEALVNPHVQAKLNEMGDNRSVWQKFLASILNFLAGKKINKHSSLAKSWESLMSLSKAEVSEADTAKAAAKMNKPLNSLADDNDQEALQDQASGQEQESTEETTVPNERLGDLPRHQSIVERVTRAQEEIMRDPNEVAQYEEDLDAYNKEVGKVNEAYIAKMEEAGLGNYAKAVADTFQRDVAGNTEMGTGKSAQLIESVPAELGAKLREVASKWYSDLLAVKQPEVPTSAPFPKMGAPGFDAAVAKLGQAIEGREWTGDDFYAHLINPLTVAKSSVRPATAALFDKLNPSRSIEVEALANGVFNPAVIKAQAKTGKGALPIHKLVMEWSPEAFNAMAARYDRYLDDLIDRGVLLSKKGAPPYFDGLEQIDTRIAELAETGSEPYVLAGLLKQRTDINLKLEKYQADLEALEANLASGDPNDILDTIETSVGLDTGDTTAEDFLASLRESKAKNKFLTKRQNLLASIAEYARAGSSAQADAAFKNLLAAANVYAADGRTLTLRRKAEKVAKAVANGAMSPETYAAGLEDLGSELAVTDPAKRVEAFRSMASEQLIAAAADKKALRVAAISGGEVGKSLNETSDEVAFQWFAKKLGVTDAAQITPELVDVAINRALNYLKADLPAKQIVSDTAVALKIAALQTRLTDHVGTVKAKPSTLNPRMTGKEGGQTRDMTPEEYTSYVKNRASGLAEHARRILDGNQEIELGGEQSDAYMTAINQHIAKLEIRLGMISKIGDAQPKIANTLGGWMDADFAEDNTILDKLADSLRDAEYAIKAKKAVIKNVSSWQTGLANLAEFDNGYDPANEADAIARRGSALEKTFGKSVTIKDGFAYVGKEVTFPRAEWENIVAGSRLEIGPGSPHSEVVAHGRSMRLIAALKNAYHAAGIQAIRVDGYSRNDIQTFLSESEIRQDSTFVDPAKFVDEEGARVPNSYNLRHYADPARAAEVAEFYDILQAEGVEQSNWPSEFGRMNLHDELVSLTRDVGGKTEPINWRKSRELIDTAWSGAANNVLNFLEQHPRDPEYVHKLKLLYSVRGVDLPENYTNLTGETMPISISPADAVDVAYLKKSRTTRSRTGTPTAGKATAYTMQKSVFEDALAREVEAHPEWVDESGELKSEFLQQANDAASDYAKSQGKVIDKAYTTSSHGISIKVTPNTLDAPTVAAMSEANMNALAKEEGYKDLADMRKAVNAVVSKKSTADAQTAKVPRSKTDLAATTKKAITAATEDTATYKAAKSLSDLLQVWDSKDTSGETYWMTYKLEPVRSTSKPSSRRSKYLADLAYRLEVAESTGDTELATEVKALIRESQPENPVNLGWAVPSEDSRGSEEEDLITLETIEAEYGAEFSPFTSQTRRGSDKVSLRGKTTNSANEETINTKSEPVAPYKHVEAVSDKPSTLAHLRPWSATQLSSIEAKNATPAVAVLNPGAVINLKENLAIKPSKFAKLAAGEFEQHELGAQATLLKQALGEGETAALIRAGVVFNSPAAIRGAALADSKSIWGSIYRTGRRMFSNKLSIADIQRPGEKFSADKELARVVNKGIISVFQDHLSKLNPVEAEKLTTLINQAVGQFDGTLTAKEATELKAALAAGRTVTSYIQSARYDATGAAIGDYAQRILAAEKAQQAAIAELTRTNKPLMDKINELTTTMRAIAQSSSSVFDQNVASFRFTPAGIYAITRPLMDSQQVVPMDLQSLKAVTYSERGNLNPTTMDKWLASLSPADIEAAKTQLHDFMMSREVGQAVAEDRANGVTSDPAAIRSRLEQSLPKELYWQALLGNARSNQGSLFAQDPTSPTKALAVLEGMPLPAELAKVIGAATVAGRTAVALVQTFANKAVKANFVSQVIADERQRRNADPTYQMGLSEWASEVKNPIKLSKDELGLTRDYYASPEMMEAFTDLFTSELNADWKWFSDLSGFAHRAKTTLSPSGIGRQLPANIGFTAGAGYADPIGMTRGLKYTFETIQRDHFGKKGNIAIPGDVMGKMFSSEKEMDQWLRSEGLKNQDVSITLRDMQARGAITEASASEAYTALMERDDSKFRKLIGYGKDADAIATALFQLSDNAAKWTTAEGAIRTEIEAHPEWIGSDGRVKPEFREKLGAMAAEYVRTFQPTMTRVMGWATSLKKLHLASFVGFRSEAIRIGAATPAYHWAVLRGTHPSMQGATDTAKAVYKARARKGIAAWVANTAMFTAGISAISSVIFGIGDEEEEDYRALLSPFEKDSHSLLLFHVDGKIRHINFDFMNTMQPWISATLQPLDTYMRESKIQSGAGALSSAVGAFLAATVGDQAKLQILPAAGVEAMMNKKAGGGEVYNEAAPLWEKWAKGLNHGLLNPLTPGAISFLQRKETYEGGATDEIARSLIPLYGTLDSRELNIEKAATAKLYSLARDQDDANRYFRAAVNDKNATPASIARAEDIIDYRTREVGMQAAETFKGWKNLGGKTHAEILSAAKTAGMDTAQVKAALNGEARGFVPNKKMLLQAEKKTGNKVSEWMPDREENSEIF